MSIRHAKTFYSRCLHLSWATILLLSCSSAAECKRNADCSNSAAAKSQIRCFSEVSCRSGSCVNECLETCTPVTPDVNPCPAAFLCKKDQPPDRSVCTIFPVQCMTELDCPLYTPILGGRTTPDSWSCTQGICRYPGLAYGSE